MFRQCEKPGTVTLALVQSIKKVADALYQMKILVELVVQFQ